MGNFVINRVFFHLNAVAHPAGLTLWLARFIAHDVILILPCAVLLGWIKGDDGTRMTCLRVLVGVAVALLFNRLIGIFWSEPRPFALGIGHQFLAQASNGGFPSDHVAILAAVGFTLLSADTWAWLGFPVLGLAVIVGWARVYLGVNWPIDMIGAFPVAWLAARSMGNTGGRFDTTILAPVLAACVRAEQHWLCGPYRRLRSRFADRSTKNSER